jgi:hypothetical protein
MNNVDGLKSISEKPDVIVLDLPREGIMDGIIGNGVAALKIREASKSNRP